MSRRSDNAVELLKMALTLRWPDARELILSAIRLMQPSPGALRQRRYASRSDAEPPDKPPIEASACVSDLTVASAPKAEISVALGGEGGDPDLSLRSAQRPPQEEETLSVFGNGSESLSYSSQLRSGSQLLQLSNAGAREATSAVTSIVTASPRRRRRDAVSIADQADIDRVWFAYRDEHARRYDGVEPKRNQEVNRCLKQLRQKLGPDDALLAIGAFFTSRNAYYLQRGHNPTCLVTDAQKLLTEALTGKAVTAAGARRVDRQADKHGQYADLVAWAQEEDRLEAEKKRQLNG